MTCNKCQKKSKIIYAILEKNLCIHCLTERKKTLEVEYCIAKDIIRLSLYQAAIYINGHWINATVKAEVLENCILIMEETA